MPTYKLCYFNLRGLGEMARIVFAEVGVEYTDERLEREGADWAERKPKTPFGKLPILFVDDVQIAHSRAILRYLGRIFNLMGSNELEAALVDMWIEVLFESAMAYPFNEQDEKKKAELADALWNDNLLPKLAKVNEQIIKSGGPYILGEKLSVADIALFSKFELLKVWFADKSLESVPYVTKMIETLENRPKIAAWLKKRPASYI
uniref:glutathione transferase n=2 Tax=Ciona intestinalis TaxID=7719 RepID=F7BDX5_CIOIN